MELIVVQREFDRPFDLQELVARELNGAWCLKAYGVRHIESILSKDRLRAICLYEAPDAEAVRNAERQIGMPMTRVWSAERLTEPPIQIAKAE